MNESDIHGLIKQSLRSPSDDFTDKLMNEIRVQKEKKAKTMRIMVAIFISCMLIFVLSLLIILPDLHILNFHMQFYHLIIPVLSISFILYELNQLHELYKMTKEFE